MVGRSPKFADGNDWVESFSCVTHKVMAIHANRQVGDKPSILPKDDLEHCVWSR